MFLGDHRVLERVVLIVEFDDRPRQLLAFGQAEALGHRAGDDVAAHHFERDDLDFADQLLTQVQALDEMVLHANAVQLGHDELGDLVIDDPLALQHGLLLGVEGGGVVLEVLNQGAGLRTFVQNLGLAFIYFLAAGGHG